MEKRFLASRTALACAQGQYTGKTRMAILYTDKSCKKAALPLNLSSGDGKSWLKGAFFELVMEDYTEEELMNIDPKLIVLAPLTLPRRTPKKNASKVGSHYSRVG